MVNWCILNAKSQSCALLLQGGVTELSLEPTGKHAYCGATLFQEDIIGFNSLTELS